MEFFKLTEQQTEDKVISRKTRIFADSLIIGSDTVLNLNTTSLAPKQKIKFYVDALKIRNFLPNYDPVKNPNAFTDSIYRVGQYYELEDYDKCKVFNSTGFYSFNYFCSANNGKGEYKINFSFDPQPSKAFWLYISNVNFEDSFYNSSLSWTNPNNPNNIINSLVPEVLPTAGGIDYLIGQETVTNITLAGRKVFAYAYAGNITEKYITIKTPPGLEVIIFAGGYHYYYPRAGQINQGLYLPAGGKEVEIRYFTSTNWLLLNDFVINGLNGNMSITFGTEYVAGKGQYVFYIQYLKGGF